MTAIRYSEHIIEIGTWERDEERNREIAEVTSIDGIDRLPAQDELRVIRRGDVITINKALAERLQFFERAQALKRELDSPEHRARMLRIVKDCEAEDWAPVAPLDPEVRAKLEAMGMTFDESPASA